MSERPADDQRQNDTAARDSHEPSPEERRDELRRELGERLRAAREQRGLSTDEAATRLRIRKDYLEALEDADWSHLPEEVYALGFLRQYARFLGEDVNEAIAELKSGDYRLTKPFTMPDPPIAPNRGWAIAAGLAFVLLLVLFNTVGDDEPPTPPEDTFSAVQAPPAGQPAQPASIDAPPAQPAATATPETANPDAEPSSSPPVGAATADTSANKAAKPSAVHRYHLMAVGGKAWLQVRDNTGALLREALLRPGQSLRLESNTPYLTVTCGNAAALQIEVDGETFAAAGALGKPGKVLRDFRITPPASD